MPGFAADKKAMPEAKTLFTNVHVFDGKSEKRVMNANVLIEGNLIKSTLSELGQEGHSSSAPFAN